MLDYSRTYFNEKDADELPIQYFFLYELEKGELDKLLAYYVAEEEIPSDVEVTLQELCLSQYSDNDFKLEVIFNGDDNNQYWVELLASVTRSEIQPLLDKVIKKQKEHGTCENLKVSMEKLIKEHGFEGVVANQIRSLWTSYCLVADLEVDTSLYDEEIAIFYEKYKDIIGGSFDEFDIFMSEDLV